MDYSVIKSLPDHVAKTYGASQFDAILDTVGSQALYKSSPKYLKPACPFVNVGTVGAKSQLGSIWRWAKNANLPAVAGGVPRKYIMFSAPLSGEGAKTLAGLVEEGKLNIVVDSIFSLEDALRVSGR